MSRFEDCPQLLCSNSLTGRCYWEVQWTGRVYFCGIQKHLETWKQPRMLAWRESAGLETKVTLSFRITDPPTHTLLAFCPSTCSSLAPWPISIPSTPHSVNPFPPVLGLDGVLARFLGACGVRPQEKLPSEGKSWICWCFVYCSLFNCKEF